MMGRQSGDQASLFYEFRLDDRVPKNHLLRRINVFVTAALLGRGAQGAENRRTRRPLHFGRSAKDWHLGPQTRRPTDDREQ